MIGFIIVLVVGSINIKREQFFTNDINQLLNNPNNETKAAQTYFLYLNPPKGSNKFDKDDLIAKGLQKRKCDVNGMCVLDSRIKF